MKTRHHPSRGALLILLVPALFLLGGCSLFGIATKGNLEDYKAEQEARDKLTAERMADLSADLNAVEGRLSDSLAKLDSDVDQMRETIMSAQLALQSIHVEMDALSTSVAQAGQESRMALDLQKETLVAERNRLRLRLQQLDEQIASWQQTLPASATQPAVQDLRPPVVPEQSELTRQDKTDQEKTGDETSIWNRRH